MRYEDISGYFTNILHLITITNVISRVVVSILIDDIAIYFCSISQTVESFIKTSILVFLSITSYLVCLHDQPKCKC